MLPTRTFVLELIEVDKAHLLDIEKYAMELERTADYIIGIYYCT